MVRLTGMVVHVVVILSVSSSV